MPVVSLEERQKINHELKKLGFGGINDPNLFAQIGTLYKTHDSFRGLLMSTHPKERRTAYEAIRPHLCFAAKPLDVYEREVKEKAEREQWDVIDHDNPHFPKHFKVGEVETEEYRLQRQAQAAIEQNKHDAAGGVLELVCLRCTKFEHFRKPTRKEAYKKAHDLGWRWTKENGTEKVYCPTDVPGRLTMTLSCYDCGKKEKVRAWDEQDGYARARLAGWVIGDVARCAPCSTKPLVLQ